MRYIFGVFIILGLFACSSTKKLQDDEEVFIYEERFLDTLTVSAPRVGSENEYVLPRYNPSYRRVHDLLHTKLQLKFNWEKQHVLGKADLSFKAIRNSDALWLDAKGFDFHMIKLNGREIEKYLYDGKNVVIPLGRVYKRDETFEVYIDYTAKPNEGEEKGSAAITSDKGLFFINPLGIDKTTPQQIWTQGETENNSRWFPTIDKPNERCTQEIYLTVQSKFETLSNGKLISSQENSDGTRTDYWKQDLPHAPYLFMLGIGEFAIVEEKWKGKDLLYYVEEEYKPYAKEIFGHTPEMLSFFSDLLNYPYPWAKYAQIIVRDYVSGAMENTTAVIFGDFVQKTDRELIDNHNDFIVAHELIHHWFGDLVTCENWANLTMNEGFANYGEYLWFEHKYGKDYAEYHRIKELNAYLQTVQMQGSHDLIWYDYEDKEHTFDAHSYNKGALVLHMLRNYVGDEIFFLGLNKYLVDNAYTEVEADELRLAMEDVSGEDLNWFFNQWYFSSGHPDLDIVYSYDAMKQALYIDVEQLQNPNQNEAIYVLAFTVHAHFKNGTRREFPVMLTKRKQRIVLEDVLEKPAVTILDGKNVLLGTKNENKSEEEYLAQFTLSDNFQDKLEAAQNLSEKNQLLVLSQAIKEDHHFFRTNIVKYISDKNTLVDLAKNDLHSDVRSNALARLKELDSDLAVNTSKAIIKTEQVFPVMAMALELISAEELTEAIQLVDQMDSDEKRALKGTIYKLYATSGDRTYLKHFEENIKTVGLSHVFNFFEYYYQLVSKTSLDDQKQTSDILKETALNGDNAFIKRYLATNTINRLKNDLIFGKAEPEKTSTISYLKDVINYIKENETDENLKERYIDF